MLRTNFGYQGRKGGDGSERETGFDVRTLLCVNVNVENQLCSTGTSALCLMVTLKWEGNPKRGAICIQATGSLCSNAKIYDVNCISIKVKKRVREAKAAI